jgi:hypothetical protein
MKVGKKQWFLTFELQYIYIYIYIQILNKVKVYFHRAIQLLNIERSNKQ